MLQIKWPGLLDRRDFFNARLFLAKEQLGHLHSQALPDRTNAALQTFASLFEPALLITLHVSAVWLAYGGTYNPFIYFKF